MTKTKKKVLLIMIGMILSKILGLSREIFVAAKYGTGVISDSFIVALSIPNILFSSISSAILINYIPIYSKIKQGDKKRSFNSNLLNILFIFITIFVILFMIFKEPILKIFVAGYTESELVYLSNIASISIFSVYFIVLGYVFKGYLEYKEKFFCTAINGIVLNFGLILGILFSNSEKYHILGYGILLGYGLNFIFLLISSIKNKFKYKLELNFKDPNIKQLCLLTLPILLNDSIWEINSIVDKTITSTIGSGYISALNYGNYISTVVITVLVTSVMTVFFPKLVKKIDDNEYVYSQIKRIFNYLFIVCLPITILCFSYSYDIVKFIFFRGAFDQSSLQITSIALKIYSCGIIFVGIKTVMFKVFYAYQDTKHPSISAIISIGLNIVLSLIFAKIFGYQGIIIATIISSFVSCLALNMFYSKKFNVIFDKSFIKQLSKVLICVLIFGLLVLIDKLFILKFVESEFLNIILIGGLSLLNLVVYYFILRKLNLVDKIQLRRKE